jgi:hypothetical protein
VFTNPFAQLSASIPPTIMQAYVVVMILMVAGGTLLDIMHKKSAKYFFDNWRSRPLWSTCWPQVNSAVCSAESPTS